MDSFHIGSFYLAFLVSRTATFPDMQPVHTRTHTPTVAYRLGQADKACLILLKIEVTHCQSKRMIYQVNEIHRENPL